MSNVFITLITLYIIFFPTIAGIVLGVLNIGVLNKEYKFWEWIFLTTTLVVSGILTYSII